MHCEQRLWWCLRGQVEWRRDLVKSSASLLCSAPVADDDEGKLKRLVLRPRAHGSGMSGRRRQHDSLSSFSPSAGCHHAFSSRRCLAFVNKSQQRGSYTRDYGWHVGERTSVNIKLSYLPPLLSLDSSSAPSLRLVLDPCMGLGFFLLFSWRVVVEIKLSVHKRNLNLHQGHTAIYKLWEESFAPNLLPKIKCGRHIAVITGKGDDSNVIHVM